MATSKLLTRSHPYYTEMCIDWDFWYLSYVGGRVYVDKNLFKFNREGKDEFDERKSRAFRENHCKTVVDKVNSYIYKEPPTRLFDSKPFDKFIRNITGTGKDINQFMNGASVWASVFGRVYIVMDKFQLGEISGTAADNLKAQPYCYLVFPKDVVDISFFEDGTVRWALIREYKRKDEDPMEDSGDMEEQFRLWEVGRWTLFDKSGESIESGETGIDIAPVIPLDSEEGPTRYNGLSMLTDTAPIDRAIFNNWSRLDTIVNDQTFSQLIFPVEAMALTEALDNEQVREKYMTLGSKRVLLYSAAGGLNVKPEYISPDASQAAFILGMIQQLSESLYSRFGLQTVNTEKTKPVSGVSKSYDLDELSRLLTTKATNLEAAERSLAFMFNKWTGQTVDVQINYPRQFDVKSLADEIILAQELSILNISETFMKEFEKRIAQKALPMAPDNTMKKIEEEIEAKKIPTEEELAAATFPFDSASPKGNAQGSGYTAKRSQTTAKVQKKGSPTGN